MKLFLNNKHLRQLLYAIACCGIIPAVADDWRNRLQDADPNQGAAIAQQCRACHSLAAGEAHQLGPNLWNLLDRKIAAYPDFDYSDALKASQGVWDLDQLDLFLRAPSRAIPGTRMSFPGIADEQQRMDLLAYLAEQHDKPQHYGSPTHQPLPLSDTFGADWPAGEGRDVTGHTCSACHSLAIVKQQKLSRKRWEQLLSWMIQEQGMPDLKIEQRQLILNYLESHFGYQ